MSDEQSDKVTVRMRELALSEALDEAAGERYPAKSLWSAVRRTGTELWLDTGDMDEASSLWCEEFSALTTNNTLLNREVQKGIYDGLIAEVAGELKGRVPEEDMVLEIAFVLNAVHGLRLNRRFGAMVSVELHTDLASDVERSVTYGRRYHAIGPDSFYVKVPLTAAGLLAARRLGEEGVNVNFTLGFSARQNYLIALVARPAFVNVFLGRLNAFVADHGLGSGRLVGEKATLASQRAVGELRARLGIATRQIAASLRDGPQVATLAGVDVMTMPPKVAREFEELNPAPETVASQVENDPEIDLAPEVDQGALGIDVLWAVPQEFRAAAQALASEDLSHMAPEDVVGFLAGRGCGDVLPWWTPADIETVRADGKIPVYEHWKERLATGEIGLDSLMNISGLYSFAADQSAMDDRIRSVL